MTRHLLFMRSVGAILGAAALVVMGIAAHAEPVTLDGQTFASLAAFLQGSWRYQQRQPEQTMNMRFGADGSFYFHNETIDVTHNGSFSATNNRMQLSLTQTCQRGKCVTNNPPRVVDYPMRPAKPNVFFSNDEEWTRVPAE